MAFREKLKAVNWLRVTYNHFNALIDDIEAVIPTKGTFKTNTISEYDDQQGVTIDGVLVKDSTVSTSTITESTNNAGVTVDSVLLKDGYVTCSSVKSTTPLVTSPVTTVSIAEYGDGRRFTTVLTLTNFIVGALAGSSGALGVGNIVAAFPAGAHVEYTSYMSISLKCAGTAVTTKTGLGSVIATGAISTLSTPTFQDRSTGQDVPTAAAGGATTVLLQNTTAGLCTGIALNKAGDVKNVFLNSAGSWNANNTGNLTATGTITLNWIKVSA